ncbi:MAG: S9 family peptidase [Spirulinaceae cyanobacterium SM2_1_0]|nr:S9 family peptidase [Spirulinaceae cyanobacterium SM2_1_0]
MATSADLTFPPLIPRTVLFGNPQRANPQLSHDGQYLAYLAPNEQDVLQVWVRRADQTEARPLTQEPKRGVQAYLWTYLPGQLIYAQDTDGDENFHLFRVEIETNTVRDLTPFPGVKAQPLGLEPERPQEMLVALNRRDPQCFDVYRLNLVSGALAPDTENPGSIVSWVADAQLQIRAAIATTADGGSALLYRSDPSQDWEMLRHWGPDESGNAVDFSHDGQILYLLSTHDANALRLLALDLSSRQETVLSEDPQYGVDDVVQHPTQRTVQAVGFYRDRLHWHILAPEIEADFAALSAVRPGEFHIVSRDLADNIWLVAYITDDGPVYYYRYDRTSRQSELLFSNQPELEAQPLVPIKPISLAARDGLTLHGYLTLPLGGETPLAAVLLVHGGPWVRDVWGYSPEVQWLANRGYAVLQINYRGSTGYGKAFLNAGNREWGAKMHDDLIDGVNWLVEQGIADPQRVAIMGGSYGGYAALAGLAFTPTVFACGVDIVGPSNLLTLLESIPPYWTPLLAMMYHRLGNPETEPEFLQARSPLFAADQIEKPLLIGQGANDPRVKKAESEQIVAAMRTAAKPVTYALYSDEGHGFARPENRLHFYALAENFLARYLGGQAEPLTDIPGTTAVVQEFPGT